MKKVSNSEAPKTQRAGFLLSFLRPLCLCVCLLLAACWVLAQAAQQAAPQGAANGDELLKQGMQAFKSNDLQAAIELFQKASEADPRSAKARVYLATAEMYTYIPGDATEENAARGRKAVAEFRAVLELNPESLPALDGLGALLYHMGQQPYSRQKLMEARSFHYRHTQLQPEDPEAHYWVGLIDWTVVYHAASDLREEHNRSAEEQLKITDPLPAELAGRFREQYAWLADDGIAQLKQAAAERPGYDDAIGYLSLLYRQKADQTTNQADRDACLQIADDLVAQAIKLKEQKAAGKASP